MVKGPAVSRTACPSRFKLSIKSEPWYSYFECEEILLSSQPLSYGRMQNSSFRIMHNYAPESWEARNQILVANKSWHKRKTKGVYKTDKEFHFSIGGKERCCIRQLILPFVTRSLGRAHLAKGIPHARTKEKWAISMFQFYIIKQVN